MGIISYGIKWCTKNRECHYFYKQATFYQRWLFNTCHCTAVRQKFPHNYLLVSLRLKWNITSVCTIVYIIHSPGQPAALLLAPVTTPGLSINVLFTNRCMFILTRSTPLIKLTSRHLLTTLFIRSFVTHKSNIAQNSLLNHLFNKNAILCPHMAVSVRNI